MPRTAESHRRPNLILAVVAAVGLEVLLIALAIAWVAVYSLLISPGKTIEDYEAHAEVSSPVVSVAAGVVCFFFAGRLLRRMGQPRGFHTAIATGAVYVVMDAAIIAAAVQDHELHYWLIAASGYAIKLAALLFAARSVARDAA